MALTKKQIKQLRAMANSLKPLFYVGKNDSTESAVNQADETIEKHELIKCAVQDGSGLTAKEAAAELAEQLNAEVVQSIGIVSCCSVAPGATMWSISAWCASSVRSARSRSLIYSNGGWNQSDSNRHYSYSPSEHRH